MSKEPKTMIPKTQMKKATRTNTMTAILTRLKSQKSFQRPKGQSNGCIQAVTWTTWTQSRTMTPIEVKWNIRGSIPKETKAPTK